MRIQTPVVWLWSCLAAFTFIHTAIAQDDTIDPFEDSETSMVSSADFADESLYPDDSVLMETQFQPDAVGGYDPAYDPAAGGESLGGYPNFGFGAPPQPYPPPMMPPNANYWPQVSPYMSPDLDRTYRQNGIWLNEGISGDRKYFMSLEYLRAWYNRPGTDLVGAPGVNTFPDLPAPFRVVNVGVLGNGENLPTDGIRAKFLMVNADTSSLEFAAWWGAESSLTYHPLGRGDPGDLTTLFPRGAITYYDGIPVSLTNPQLGHAVRFDTDFKLNFKSQAFGGDITWASMPFYETDGFRLRMVAGAQYLKIREQFTFHGEDSGLTYTAVGISGNPLPPVTDNLLGLPPFTSDMTSRTRSDVVGPMAGIRYELGGKHFLLTGQTKFTVAANSEIINLYGNQMGDGRLVGFPVPTPGNPKPAGFDLQQSATHVSPVFNQDFGFKGKVFKHLPFFNDIPLFANADMLVNYNYILVGGVSRPTKIIDYRSDFTTTPFDHPRIVRARSRWNIQAVTFGLQWEF